MSCYQGNKLHLSIFGESHGKAVGMCLQGVPAGLTVDFDQLQAFLSRRAPGQSDLTSSRKEADIPEFLSGLLDGHTTGSPIAALIWNRDVRRADYDAIRDCPRPGHADLTGHIKYSGFQDSAGGGHFSGRLTAPLCIAGGLCLQWLAQQDIQVDSRLISLGNSTDPSGFKLVIQEAQQQQDSVGGIIECSITGLPVGLGGPLFEGMEGKLSQLLFAIPGVKGVEFGSGFAGSTWLGSENNDPYILKNGKIFTKTNHCGGILGGITTGGPLVFRVAVKPTPSIGKPQQSICLSRMEPQVLEISGRHDPCIALRALPVVEAVAALGVYDALLAN